MSGSIERPGYGERPPGSAGGTDQRLSELFNQVANDLGVLMATQIELAKVELRDEAVRVGHTARLLGAGAASAVLAAVLLAFAAAWGIGEALDSPGLGFMITGALAGAAALAMVMRGRSQMRRMTPIAPRTMGTLRDDARLARGKY